MSEWLLIALLRPDCNTQVLIVVIVDVSEIRKVDYTVNKDVENVRMTHGPDIVMN